ncbi:MAG: LicD family protein [Rhizobiales bacterium]|mgnify:CR=1 FL=1|jgi:hypothetical protein|nr:LicD family protein [Hyphomicrobiales bacterium]
MIPWQRVINVQLADRIAGYIHELHRIRLPLTKRMVLPLNVKALERQLLDIHDAFGHEGVRFWLRDGTALGLYRDGGIIPFDDDVDLGVWDADTPKIEAALKRLSEKGFIIHGRNRYTIRLLRDWETVEIAVSGLPVECWGGNLRYIEIQEAFFRDLVPMRFLGRDFLVPRDIEGYLEFSYGKDWSIPKPQAWWSHTWWLKKDEKQAHVESYDSAGPTLGN